jgi:putative aminopeptidase FrvX
MDGMIRRVIQDRDCRLQVGGDDRLGVAIITWIALNTGYDMGLYFPTDEEVGLRSARACKMERLKAFELIAQVDRGNHTDELVNKIGGEQLADYATTCRALLVAYHLGMPRTIVNGAGTDVAALKSNGYAKQAFNMTCGYHNSYSSQPNEYIDIEEANNTMKFVAGLVKDYNLNGPFIELPVEEAEEAEVETEQK